MILYTLLLVTSVLSVCTSSADNEMLINLGDSEPESKIIFSSSLSCNSSIVWNITTKPNSTDQSPQYVKSLVISNLVLESGSSLTITSNTTNPNVLNITGEGSASLPILYLDANVTHIVNYTRAGACSNYPRTLLQSYWATVTNDACLPIAVTDKQSFKSYNYPNNYPLQEATSNTQCRNISSPAAKIYVTFIDVDLAEGHKVELLYSSGSVNLTDSKILRDKIVSNKTIINFDRPFNPLKNTTRNINDKLSGRGFNIILEPLECGGEIETKDGFHVFNMTEKPEKCVWIIRTPNAAIDTIKVLNFSLSDGLDNVSIHDSDSIKNKLFVNRTGPGFINSTSETIIIEYTSSNTTTANLTWSTFDCFDRCESIRRCINPSERCNGANDCGDWSDELHCNGSAPIPKPEPVKASGVPGLVVVFVIIPLAMIVGILGTIFFPRIVARIRGGRYQEFREYSDVS